MERRKLKSASGCVNKNWIRTHARTNQRHTLAYSCTLTFKNANLFDTATRVIFDWHFCMLYCDYGTHIKWRPLRISWSRKLRVTSPDKQASVHAPRFGTQSKQSSKQPD